MSGDEIAKALGFLSFSGLLIGLSYKVIPIIWDKLKAFINIGDDVKYLKEEFSELRKDVSKISMKVTLDDKKRAIYSDTAKARVLQVQYALITEVFDSFEGDYSSSPMSRMDAIHLFRTHINEYYGKYEVKHALNLNTQFINSINRAMNNAIRNIFYKYYEEHLEYLQGIRKDKDDFYRFIRNAKDEFIKDFTLYFEDEFQSKREG